ncbi:MAG: SGNH/GDSL hydrolase family protein [Aggregatilineales bacterium]
MTSRRAILCYGDSNTWGYQALSAHRLPYHQRWTGVLAGHLGDNYLVIEEGLPGRTTVWDDPIDAYHSGKTYLTPCLASHAPLHMVIILLGTNDLKSRFGLGAYDIALGAGMLAQMAQRSETGPNGTPPDVLLVSPPPLGDIPEEIAPLFEGGRDKSIQMVAYYRHVAEQIGCRFMDAGAILTVDPRDGVHWTPAGHAAFAAQMAQHIRDHG